MEANAMPGGYKYPPGFRFHPSDQELITHYLNKKVTGTLRPTDCIIAEIDLYKFSPWDLPAKAFFGDGEWFFFSPRERKYPNGARPNRAAGLGYWKATGTDKPILAVGGTQCLGVKKALVFYKGRPPKGIKTDWVMHEYRLLDRNSPLNLKHKGTMRLDDWVLCRVRQKGLMPQGEENNDNPTNTYHIQHEIQNEVIMYNIQHEEVKEEVKPRDSTTQWGDYQLLAYLMVGSSEEEQNKRENSDSGSTKSSFGEEGSLYMNPRGCAVRQTAQVSSVLNMAKRNLTYGVMDEMMALSPSKRVSLSGRVADQMSPSGSLIVEQVYI